MYLTPMKAQSILSFLSLAFALTLNAMAIVIPLNGHSTKELSDRYPNLFVPADLTFSIWSVIYLGLFAYVGYFLYTAFYKKSKNAALLATSPWFLISCLANGSWIVAWHHLQVELALAIMLVMLFSLIMIYLRVRSTTGESSVNDEWFVILPFSIYLSWISVATVANTTAVLVDNGFTGFGISEPEWTVIMISVAGLLALILARRYRDLPYLLTLVWAVGGIYLKRNPFLFPEHRMITTACIVWLSILALVVAVIIVSPTLEEARKKP